LTRSRFQKLLHATLKGRVLDRLRHAPQTVEQVATTLGVTANAVRPHLAALERDGLVRRGEPRPTTRRPSHTYRLAPGVETFFCQAYIPFLDQLLGVLTGSLDDRQLDRAMRTVGRRLAPSVASQTVAARVAAAAAVLDEMGGVTEVTTRGNGEVTYVIQGSSCPFDTVVRSHPAVCVAVESLVAEMTQARSRQSCHQAADKPHCVIEVGPIARRSSRATPSR
jgi:predicted ArsR family transcriptional regulator